MITNYPGGAAQCRYQTGKEGNSKHPSLKRKKKKK